MTYLYFKNSKKENYQDKLIKLNLNTFNGYRANLIKNMSFSHKKGLLYFNY